MLVDVKESSPPVAAEQQAHLVGRERNQPTRSIEAMGNNLRARSRPGAAPESGSLGLVRLQQYERAVLDAVASELHTVLGIEKVSSAVGVRAQAGDDRLRCAQEPPAVRSRIRVKNRRLTTRHLVRRALRHSAA